jgi:hypothetical protein
MAFLVFLSGSVVQKLGACLYFPFSFGPSCTCICHSLMRASRSLWDRPKKKLNRSMLGKKSYYQQYNIRSTPAIFHKNKQFTFFLVAYSLQRVSNLGWTRYSLQRNIYVLSMDSGSTNVNFVLWASQKRARKLRSLPQQIMITRDATCTNIDITPRR